MLVELKHDYFVDIDSFNHTLKQHVPPKPKEDGKYTKGYDRIVGYYPNMGQALRGAKRDIVARGMSSKSFDQWLEVVKGLDLE